MLIFAHSLQNPGVPEIQNAAVWIKGNEIAWFGKQENLPTAAKADPDAYTLNNTILCPGLVNAHCHLELTELEATTYPGNFDKWVRNIIELKNSWSPHTNQSSFEKGIYRTLMGGCTSIGDHVSFNSEVEHLLNSPLRGKAFIEVLGIVPEVAQEILAFSLEMKKNFSKHPSLIELTPSPHSIHALDAFTLEELMRGTWPLFSIHIAESQEEYDYFAHQSGGLFKLIAERGKELIRPYSSAIEELSAKKLLDGRVLIVHGNYLSEKEIKIIAQNQISVVHCVLSHQYFSHQAFPIQSLLKDKVNIALGTDSLASARSLSMFEIMRSMKKSYPFLKQDEIFYMATLGGAKALKMEDEIGEIKVGKKADLIGVYAYQNSSALESIFKAPQINFCMIDGKIL